MRTAILFSLVTCSWAAAAPGPKDPPPKPSPLIGEWQVISHGIGGDNRQWEDGDRIFAFTADGRYSDSGGGTGEKALWQKYRADDKADPPTLDILDHPRRKGTLRWLYKVDGDILTICLGGEPTVRPKAIEAGKGSKNMVLTLKRVAPKK